MQLQKHLGVLKRILPELFVILAGIYIYAPHFIYINIPIILNDSYAYILLAQDFLNGKIPLAEYTRELPYGYSLFIYVIYFFGGNMQTVILLQTLIFFSSLMILTNKIKKHISWSAALISSMLIAGFVSLSDIILYNTLIITESLYMATIFFLAASMICYLREPKTKTIIIITILVFFAAIIRSNGIYLSFILFFIALRTYFNSNKRKIITIIFAFIGILIFSSATNYFIRGDFLPLDSNRLKRLINKKYTESEQDTVIYDPYSGTLKSQTIKLLVNPTYHKFGDHYYYRLPRQLENFNTKLQKEEIIAGGYIEKYKYSNENEENTYEFITRNIEFDKNTRKNKMDLLDIEQKPRHAWLFSIHLVHMLKPVMRNWIFLIMFYLFYFYSIYYLFSKNEFINSIWELVFYIGSIHMFNVFILIPMVPRDTSLCRYSLVTELMFYLVIAISISEVFLHKIKDMISSKFNLNKT